MSALPYAQVVDLMANAMTDAQRVAAANKLLVGIADTSCRLQLSRLRNHADVLIEALDRQAYVERSK